MELGSRRRNSRKRNIRRKARDESEDDGETKDCDGGEVPVPVRSLGGAQTAARAGRASAPRGAGASHGGKLLSFVEEEEAEGEASKIKRRKIRRLSGSGQGEGASEDSLQFSRGGARFSKSYKKLGREMAAQLSSSGEYTAERLRQLKEANRMRNMALSEVGLKGSFKPPPAPAGGNDDDDDAVDADADGNVGRDATNGRDSPLGQGARAPSPADASPAIPSQREIDAARSNRERWRQKQAFVPIAEGGEADAMSSDDDEDTENQRLKFTFHASDNGASDRPTAPGGTIYVQDDLPSETLTLDPGFAPRTGSAAAAGGSGDVDDRARAAMDRLKSALKAAEEREVFLDKERCALRDKAEFAEEKEAQLASKLELLREDYRFLQEMKQYFSDLCECLQEKAPIIEEVEEQVDGLRRVAGERELGQKRQAIRVMSAALQGGVLQALMLGGGDLGPEDLAAVEASVEKQVRDLSERHCQETEGEDIASAVALERAWYGDYRGMTTDFLSSESQYPREEATAEKLRKLLEFSHTICSDVDEDYCSLALMKQRLEHFKAKSRKAYFQAYVPESLPQLLSPFVRLDMLHWNPCDPSDPKASDPNRAPPEETAGSRQIKSMGWHGTLENYGKVEGASRRDLDDDLVPTLVDRVVLPRLKSAVLSAWDVTNFIQTKAIKGCLEECFDLCDSEERATQANRAEALSELILEVKNKIYRELDLAAVPMWPQKCKRSVGLSAGFVGHAVRRAVHMFAGAMSFSRLMEREAVVRLAVEEIFAKRLLSFMKTLRQEGDAEALSCIAAQLCNAVPLDWTEGPGGLESLVSFVKECLEGWEGGAGGDTAAARKNMEDMRRFLARVDGAV